MIDLAYMGTKHRIAPTISDVICQAKPGIVLDAFAGMCAVGTAIGERRSVWNNDAQAFAAAVARSLFVANDVPPNILTAADLLFDNFARNRDALCKRFQHRLEAERDALDSLSIDRLRIYWEAHQNSYSTARV